MERPLRLAMANDYAVVIAGVASFLADERIDVVETAASLPVVTDVDIVLFDTFGQVTGNGIDLEDYVRDSGAKVVIYSWNLKPDLIQQAMAGGASGYLSKVLPGPVVVEALERIMNGETVIMTGASETSVGGAGDWPGRSAGLSPREAEVLALIAHGLSNKEIAERAFVSPNTIKNYIRSAYRKIGVERRTQAVIWAMDNGFPPDRKRTIDLGLRTRPPELVRARAEPRRAREAPRHLVGLASDDVQAIRGLAPGSDRSRADTTRGRRVRRPRPSVPRPPDRAARSRGRPRARTTHRGGGSRCRRAGPGPTIRRVQAGGPALRPRRASRKARGG